MKIPFLFNRRYLAYEFNQKMDTNITDDDVQYSIESDIPQQENTYDCGVYVCEYAEKITRNASRMTTASIPESGSAVDQASWEKY